MTSLNHSSNSLHPAWQFMRLQSLQINQLIPPLPSSSFRCRTVRLDSWMKIKMEWKSKFRAWRKKTKNWQPIRVSLRLVKNRLLQTDNLICTFLINQLLSSCDRIAEWKLHCRMKVTNHLLFQVKLIISFLSHLDNFFQILSGLEDFP